MATEQNFEIFSANDIVLDVSVTDEDSGDALSLAGVMEIIWAVSKTAGSAVKFQKTLTETSISVVSAVDGTLMIDIDEADTEDLAGDYYHEMRITNAASKKVTVMFGALTILKNTIRG